MKNILNLVYRLVDILILILKNMSYNVIIYVNNYKLGDNKYETS